MASTKRIEALRGGICEPATDDENAFGGVCRLPRPSGKRPLQLLASPVGSGNSFARRKLTLIFVSDPEDSARIRESVLCQLFDLTPAESAIASRIASGASVEDICSSLNITQNTCRTHLKRIFSKTETSRQAELVNLVLTSVASLPAPENF